jgi:hypothetical protein
MSAPFTLRQPAARADDARGITLRLPVYTAGPAPETLGERRRRETGALALSMRVRPLLLAALPAEALQRFRIHALDVTGPVPLTLYESGGDPGDQARDFGGEVAFGGRRWHLRLSPLQDPSNAAVLWAVATGGLLASLLLAALAWSIADTRRRALRVGHQMSARYRESEEQFRTLNDVLPALVLMARAEDGRVMYANQVAQARLGERIGDGGPVRRRVAAPATAGIRRPGVVEQRRRIADDAQWRQVLGIDLARARAGTWRGHAVDGGQRRFRAAAAHRTAQLPGHP